MKLPAEQISERLADAGKAAGFDVESFSELRARHDARVPSNRTMSFSSGIDSFSPRLAPRPIARPSSRVG
jgi:hypothetical protein